MNTDENANRCHYWSLAEEYPPASPNKIDMIMLNYFDETGVETPVSAFQANSACVKEILNRGPVAQLDKPTSLEGDRPKDMLSPLNNLVHFAIDSDNVRYQQRLGKYEIVIDNLEIIRSNIRARLSASLQDAFDELDFPAASRARFIDRAVEDLLSEARNSKESLQLPITAPAMWTKDREPNDTPADFIMRTYRPWLRSDCTGLTRPILKQLDRSLYFALSKWLRYNTLPSDCQIPTKNDVVTAEMAASKEPPSEDESVRDFRRRTSRERYRRSSAMSRD